MRWNGAEEGVGEEEGVLVVGGAVGGVSAVVCVETSVVVVARDVVDAAVLENVVADVVVV